MEAAEIQNVCRLCPADQFQNENSLINVFDNNVQKNMMEVILVTTGIQISKNDMISTKICQRCCSITLNMYKFRQDALKKDRALKEKFQQMLTNRSFRVGSSSVPIDNDQSGSKLKEEVCKLVPSTGSHIKHKLHPSITQLYQTYPNIKLPKTCVDKHMAPVVAIPLHAVQLYMDNQQLTSNHKIQRNVAKKRTGSSTNRNKIMAKVSKGNYECSNMTADLTGVVKNKLQDDMNQCNVAENTVSNDPFKKHFQDSASGSVSNRSVENNVGTCQPTFLKSVGLTPTAKFRQIYVCSICKSVYDSAEELKHHKYKHVLCQFCKQKFISVEEKELHIKSPCEVIKRFSSPFPIVFLEKIHLNVDIRKSCKDAFFDFDPIFENKVEPIALPSASSSFPDDSNNIIILSDDDDVQCQTTNIVNTDVPRASAVVPAHSETDIVYKTVSIVKPNITINRSPLLNSIRASNISDKAFLTEVITLLKPAKNTTDALSQTNLPTCKDININKLTCSCDFKNLTSELFSYKIPVYLEQGFFHICYEFNTNYTANSTKAHWKTLELIDTNRNTPAATINDRAISSGALNYVSPLNKSALGSTLTEPRLDATPVSTTTTVIPTSLRGGSTSNTSSTFVRPTYATPVSSPKTVIPTPLRGGSTSNTSSTFVRPTYATPVSSPKTVIPTPLRGSNTSNTSSTFVSPTNATPVSSTTTVILAPLRGSHSSNTSSTFVRPTYATPAFSTTTVIPTSLRGSNTSNTSLTFVGPTYATPVSSTTTVIPSPLRGSTSNTFSTFVSPTPNIAVSSESSGPVYTDNTQPPFFQSYMQLFEMPPPAPPINKSIPVPSLLENSALIKKASTYTPRFDPRYKVRPTFHNNHSPNVYYKRNPKKPTSTPNPQKNIHPSSSASTQVTSNSMAVPLNGFFQQNSTAGGSAQTFSSLLNSPVAYANNQFGTPTNASVTFPTQQTAPSASVLQIVPVVSSQPGAPLHAIPNTASTERPKFRVKSVFELQ